MEFDQSNGCALFQEVGEVREVTSSISSPTLLSVWGTLWSIAWQEALVAHLGVKLLTPCGTSFELVTCMSHLMRKLSRDPQCRLTALSFVSIPMRSTSGRSK